jgi:hypothetical protein
MTINCLFKIKPVILRQAQDERQPYESDPNKQLKVRPCQQNVRGEPVVSYRSW